MKTELFTNEELLSKLDEFDVLYETRLIKNNEGGMTSSQMFPSWYLMNIFKPKFIIESGVFKGQGTWFFEKASPDSKIISIEPNLGGIIYKSSSVKYLEKDFSTYSWNEIEDKENTILFFDDHQNSLERIKLAKKLGFNKLIIEDNYPSSQGDCYSPKRILMQKDYVTDLGHSNRTWTKFNKKDHEYFMNNVKIYFEFPPIFKVEITRWGDAWNEENYPTKPPLLSNEHKDKYPIFYNECPGFVWICYLELN